MGRNLKVLYILLIVTVLVTACGVEKHMSVLTSKNFNIKTQEDDPSSYLSEPSYKNKGVITDTVADVFKNPDTGSERVTQAVYNEPVDILEEQEGWLKVQVVDGCTGWVKTRYIDRDYSSIAGEFKFRIIITSKTKKIYSEPKGGLTIKEVVMGTELYSTRKSQELYEVVLPGRLTGWVSESGTIQISPGGEVPKTTGEAFAATVTKLNGTIYLWGGVSAWNGVDSSGLIYICSKINGVNLPRGTQEQFNIGTPVERDSIKPGDIVFFSSMEDQGDVSLAGVIIQGNQFVYASKSRGNVITASLEDEYFNNRIIGIKRIF